MRTALALLLSLAALPAGAAPPVGPGAPDAITIQFLPGTSGGAALHRSGADARVDFGTVSAKDCRSGRAAPSCDRSLVVRRDVRVLLETRSGAQRFAKLSAFLAGHPGEKRVRVDGVLLSSLPQLVDPSAPIGTAVQHVIEIEVPHSEPPGRLDAAITWIAATD